MPTLLLLLLLPLRALLPSLQTQDMRTALEGVTSQLTAGSSWQSSQL
jgi:hypothetical protein